MKKYPKVSIIIPLYVISDRFFSDLRHYQNLDYSDFEILVVCDKKVDLPKLKGVKVKLLLTGKKNTGPAAKRDLAIKKVKGEICAFIDDDAYPDRAWLKKAVRHFKKNEIIAVGGPGITPQEDFYWEKVAGLSYESFFMSGAAQHRFVPLSPRYLNDWPAYNLLVRKSTLAKVGGYGSSFYGGEDTFLCLKLIKFGKIYYEPEAVIYHHRRKILLGFLSQIANVGLHRGYFARIFPETSRKLFYFLPSILTALLFSFVVIAFIQPPLISLLIYSILFFIFLGAMSVINKTNLITSILVGLCIIFAHITYGIYFIWGLLKRDLKK